MSNYGWGTEDYIGPDGTVWNARNTSYSDNFKYCNIDNSKYRTVRNGYDNGSIYLAGTTTLENGIEINADVHYWETEANNVYYPYFVQQSYYAPAVIGNDGVVIADGAGNPGPGIGNRSVHPAMFRFGGAYLSGQRFFAEKTGKVISRKILFHILLCFKHF